MMRRSSPRWAWREYGNPGSSARETVNLVNASNALGTASGLTLVDKIHVMVLVYLVVAAIVTVVSRVLLDRGLEAADIAGLNYQVGAIVAISFVALNALLIVLAVRGG